MIKRIHVNQHVIRSNKKTGKPKPCLTIKTSKSNEYAYEVDIKGPCKIVYRPNQPLSCGAQLWVETSSEINLQKTLKVNKNKKSQKFCKI